MFKVVAMAALAVSAVFGNAVAAGEQSVGSKAQTGGPEADASQRAQKKLAEHLKIALNDVIVNHIEPRTWSDSSMGCRKRATAALAVITAGYEVSLSVKGRDHRVHVSGRNAMVCDRALSLRREPRAQANAQGLDVMIEQAKQDLAQQLGVQPSTIRVSGMQHQRWANSGLNCPRENEWLQKGPIAGYRLSLRLGPRIYIYHTDRKTVRACPPIESD